MDQSAPSRSGFRLLMSDSSEIIPEIAPPSRVWNPLRWPLPVRVLIGVIVGALIGTRFGRGPIAFGWTNADSGVLAGFYIQLLTALATPLIFFAIVEAFVQTQLTGRQGLKMAAICLVNIAVAFAIGLTILNVWTPGKSWQGSLGERADAVESTTPSPASPTPNSGPGSLAPLDLIRSHVPKNALQPFIENIVLTVAIFAIAVGAAMRSLRSSNEEEDFAAVQTFERFIVACYRILLRILSWLIELAPIAIFLAVASAVGNAGPGVFKVVGIFFATVLGALSVHALIYYPLSAWLIGGKSPRTYLGEGISAILTGFSINSSLATAPLTLDALRRMGVSEASARLSACVGTNFNNDGITLYEAITALFIAQAAGLEMTLGQQAMILVAALVGSMGIAGIPNSGLIILSLVLKAARLPEETVQLAIPIVYSVDFINARLRSAVNVMGDMQVAILLDAGSSASPPATTETH
jgi:Na+/H+-dicarboxylate symporter